MLIASDMVAAFESAGVRFFTGVPDSLLKAFCACLQDTFGDGAHLIAANEGAAIGHAIGYHVASGTVPLVYLQNSGLGNTINPLASGASHAVFRTPMVLMVGWRGEPGVRDEPQHRFQGAMTEQQLSLLDIPTFVVDAQSDGPAIANQAVTEAIARSAPVAILVRKGAFEDYASKQEGGPKLPKREEALRTVCDVLPTDAIVIATTGKLSRELFELRSEDSDAPFRDLLVVGSMGHCHAIALGAAMAQPDRPVFCLDGDGSALMHLGTLAVSGVRALPNLRYLLFNNGAHESVGGQPTIAFEIDWMLAAKAFGFRWANSVSTLDALRDQLRASLEQPTASFLEVRIAVGSRSDLSRPTASPEQVKQNLMRMLGTDGLPEPNP